MIYWIAENILGGTSMDVFVEQIVKKRNTTKDIAVIVGIILAALILCFVFAIILPALVPILGTLSLFLVAGTIFGAYWLISSMNLEFEYHWAVLDAEVKAMKKYNSKLAEIYEPKVEELYNMYVDRMKE